MTTKQFPFDALFSFDSAVLVGLHDLDQCNPGVATVESPWFHNYDVGGAVCSRGYVDCEWLSAENTPVTRPFTFTAWDAQPQPAVLFGTTALTIKTELEFQTTLFASLKTLSRYGLVEQSLVLGVGSEINSSWCLPGGQSIVSKATYTRVSLPESERFCVREDAEVWCGDWAVYRQTRTGSSLLEYRYRMKNWGCWTARRLITERDKLLVNVAGRPLVGKRRIVTIYDPTWGPRTVDAVLSETAAPLGPSTPESPNDRTEALRLGKSPHARIVGTGRPREETRRVAEDYVRKNGFPGLNELARRLKLQESSLSNAIDRSAYLKARFAEYKQAKAGKPRETPLTNVGLDRTPQQREPSPVDEAIENENPDASLHRLIAEQEADQRADRSRPRRMEPDRLA